MPPPNRGRVIDAESTISRRVKIERERRGWSLERTAQAMTDVGCPTASTAILKLERTDSRRRIQGDEIAAFAQIFDLEVGELFRPIDAADELRARYRAWCRELTDELDAGRRQREALGGLLDAARETPDLEELGDLGVWLASAMGNWGKGAAGTGGGPAMRALRFDVRGYHVQLDAVQQEGSA